MLANGETKYALNVKRATMRIREKEERFKVISRQVAEIEDRYTAALKEGIQLEQEEAVLRFEYERICESVLSAPMNHREEQSDVPVTAEYFTEIKEAENESDENTIARKSYVLDLSKA